MDGWASLGWYGTCECVGACELFKVCECPIIVFHTRTQNGKLQTEYADTRQPSGLPNPSPLATPLPIAPNLAGPLPPHTLPVEPEAVTALEVDTRPLCKFGCVDAMYTVDPCDSMCGSAECYRKNLAHLTEYASA